MFKIKKAFFSTLLKECVNEKVFSHTPALLNEVINIFQSTNCEVVLDLTFGYGGHSKAIINCNKTIKHIGIDRDEIAYQHAVELGKLHPHFTAAQGKFSDLNQICNVNNISKQSVDFILMDLGASSIQMDDGQRGFSISKNARLDMRMNQNSKEISAFEAINLLNEDELTDIIRKYGEERQSKKIARTIVDYRKSVGQIVTTNQLGELIANSIGRGHNYDSLKRKCHPATQVFQALRIFINDELNELCSAITIAKQYLKPVTGRCAIITFHSLEDRLVKYAFFGKDFRGIDKSFLQSKPSKSSEEWEMYDWTQVEDIVTPTNEEISTNPRVRSAKMRIGKTMKN